jgi:Uma2 family endonuclease
MAPVGQVVRPRVSYSDLERQPEDGRRYEIYDGEVYVVPAPVPLHQRAVGRLYRILDDYAADHGGEVFTSPIDIVFSEYDVIQPDLVYFSSIPKGPPWRCSRSQPRNINCGREHAPARRSRQQPSGS